jgi:hypothetical protein
MSFTLDTPAVIEALTGVWRSTLGGKTFYRIDESGAHVTCPIRRELIALGMGASTATKLLLNADLPVAPFVRTQPIEQTTAPPPAKRPGPPPISEEQRDEKRARAEEAQNSKQFQLIATNSGKFGIWDGTDARVLSLFYVQSEAIAELARLKAGKSYVTYNN